MKALYFAAAIALLPIVTWAADSKKDQARAELEDEIAVRRDEFDAAQRGAASGDVAAIERFRVRVRRLESSCQAFRQAYGMWDSACFRLDSVKKEDPEAFKRFHECVLREDPLKKRCGLIPATRAQPPKS